MGRLLEPHRFGGIASLTACVVIALVGTAFSAEDGGRLRTCYVNAAAAREGDGSKARPFKSLATALGQRPADTQRLLLADGLYTVSSTLPLDTIIESQSGKAGKCIIDGEHKCRLFKQTDAARFKGVTLRNGIATDNANGGNTVNNAAGKGLGFYNCIIEGGITTNTAGAVAGNVWMPGGTLIVSNCVIRNNYVYDTVDMWGGGGFVAMQNGSPAYKFYNTVASNNVFELSSRVRNDRGGAVVFSNVGCELYDCTFVDNLTTNRNSSGWARGGVAYARGGMVKAERCAFVRNRAHTGGSAIYGSASLTDCAFTNNLSLREGGNSRSGTVVGEVVTAVRCDFNGNTNRLFEVAAATNIFDVITAGSEAKVSNCTFALNSVLLDRKGHGGCQLEAPLTNSCIAPRVALDLAGVWEHSVDGKKWKRVLVPDQFGSEVDVVHQFRRRFTTPKNWKPGDRAIVNFEVIGYEYEVFVNGEKAAAHGYSYGIPQRVDISKRTRPGENELLVKTVRPGKKTPGHENEVRDFPNWFISEPWCPLGIVMPVHIEFTGAVCIEGVFVKPHVEGGKRLEVEVCVTNVSMRSTETFVEAKAKGEGEQWKVSDSVRLKAGEGKVVTLKGDWPEAHLWTPDDPHLYNLDVRLRDDAYRVRFGFREVTVKGHRFYLNGHPFIARASTHLPDQRQSADDYRAFFARCKAAGVNSFRSRYREHARTLELADECGAFIMPQAMDSWCSNKHSPIFWKRFQQQLREMVRTYRNHPSVLLWGLSNEFGTFYSGALGKEGPEGEKAGTDRQAEAGAVFTAEDPTRVWTACGDVDLCYPARGRNGPAPTRSFHYPVKYCEEGWELPLTNTVYWYQNGRESWQNNSEKDKPLCITEDLYHGVLDQPLGMSRYAGDDQWTIDGWCRTIHWIVHQVAAGFYTSGLGWWDLWTIEKGGETSHYRDYGQMMPDFLVAMVEPPRNVRAGERVSRTVRAFNETFTAHDCSLMLNGREVAAFKLQPGEFFEKKVSLVAPNDLPDGSSWSWRMRLVDRKTGAALTEESFEFRVFSPEKPLTLPKAIGVYARKASPLLAMAAEGRVYHDLQTAADACRYLIVDEVLTNRDRDDLERFVRGGGRVLYFPEQEFKQKSAEPFRLQYWRMQTFVWRRDPEAMKEFPEEAFRLWMPDGLVGLCGMYKLDADCDVLWDSGSCYDNGLEFAQIARVYRGTGNWLVCVPPVMAKYHEEPCCPALFRSLLRELASKKTRPTGTVRITSAAKDGELVKIFAEMGVATNSTKSSVRWIDASQGFGKDLQKVVLDVERKGGLVVVTDLPADVDPEFLGRFGLKTVLPKTGVRTLHPFKPSWIGADSDSDQGVKWVTIDKANAGLLKGVSNEDVFWWEPGDFVGYIPNLIVGFPPRGAAWNSKERNVMVACTATLASVPGARHPATLHTIPAAWAEAKVGKGRVVLSTMKIAGSSQKARKRVKRFLRRVLMNAGVRTSEDPEQVFWETRYVDLKSVANRGYWGNDKAFLGDPTADLRYFPVNLCGWSQISRAPCPREDFPERAVNLAGESFKLLDPEKNGGKGLIFLDNNDSVTVDLGKGVRFDELHLLLSHAGPGLKMSFDGGDSLPVERTGPFLVKKGETCGTIAWQGKTDDGRDTALYRTVVKNPQPDRLVRKIVFSNPTLGRRKSNPAAILAVTMKSKVMEDCGGGPRGRAVDRGE